MAICLATKDLLRAVSGTRTRDFRLGKPTLYQLSYYRNSITDSKVDFIFGINKNKICLFYSQNFMTSVSPQYQ